LTITPDKSTAALQLVEAHLRSDPSINRVVRVIGGEESAVHEPIKLLEVNPDTSPSGIVPIAFGPNPPLTPYSTVIIEVTEEEFESIRAGDLTLPEGWSLGETLYPSAA